jgi:hypothetical protein
MEFEEQAGRSTGRTDGSSPAALTAPKPLCFAASQQYAENILLPLYAASEHRCKFFMVKAYSLFRIFRYIKPGIKRVRELDKKSASCYDGTGNLVMFSP